MSMVFLIGIFMLIFIFGGMVLAGFAIWALATKKDTLPQWVKIILWLFVVLAGILLITGIVFVFSFLSKFVMH
jgi:hypothetical protein